MDFANFLRFGQFRPFLVKKGQKRQISKIGLCGKFLFTKRHLHTKFYKISSNGSQDNLLRTEGRTHKGELSKGPVGLQPGTNKMVYLAVLILFQPFLHFGQF